MKNAKKKIIVTVSCDEFFVADSLREIADRIESAEVEYDKIGALAGEHYTANLHDNVRRITVDWDTDGEEADDLPTEVELPEHLEEDDISDWLSDTFGYCHNGWTWVIAENTINQL